jgi:hypothetical protein
MKQWGFKKYKIGTKGWEYIEHRLQKISTRQELPSGKSLGKRKGETEVYVDGVLYPPEKMKRGISRKVYRSTIERFTSGSSAHRISNVVYL